MRLTAKNLYRGKFVDSRFSREDLFNILKQQAKAKGINLNQQQVTFITYRNEDGSTIFEATIDIPNFDEQQALLMVENLLLGKSNE